LDRRPSPGFVSGFPVYGTPMDEAQVREAILGVVSELRVSPTELAARVGAPEGLVRHVMEKLIDTGELEVDRDLLLTAPRSR